MKRNNNIIRIINVIWSNINQDLTLNEILSCLCVQCFHAMFVFRCSHNLCVSCWQKSAQTGGAVFWKWIHRGNFGTGMYKNLSWRLSKVQRRFYYFLHSKFNNELRRAFCIIHQKLLTLRWHLFMIPTKC